MEFFDFGNSLTFHFFKWITESGQATPQILVTEAFEKAETDTEHFADEDVCIIVRDVLAHRLAELLADVASDQDADPACAPELGNVWNSREALWKPLLADAFAAIDCGAAAQALLIRGGKWNPSKEPPEVV